MRAIPSTGLFVALLCSMAMFSAWPVWLGVFEHPPKGNILSKKWVVLQERGEKVEEVLRYMRSQGMYEKTANVFRSSFSMEARRVFSIPISLV